MRMFIHRHGYLALCRVIPCCRRRRKRCGITMHTVFRLNITVLPCKDTLCMYAVHLTFTTAQTGFLQKIIRKDLICRRRSNNNRLLFGQRYGLRHILSSIIIAITRLFSGNMYRTTGQNYQMVFIAHFIYTRYRLIITFVSNRKTLIRISIKRRRSRTRLCRLICTRPNDRLIILITRYRDAIYQFIIPILTFRLIRREHNNIVICATQYLRRTRLPCKRTRNCIILIILSRCIKTNCHIVQSSR